MAARDGHDTPLTADEIAAVRRPFRAATTLPSRTYHDPAIFAWEQANWFARGWICVGRGEDVPEPGSFVTVELAGEPLLVVRGRDDRIRAFHNVCRHRGTAVVQEASGRAVRFQCPYHAWTYDLDGRLIRAKHTDDLVDFDPATVHLTEARLESWAGFLFVALEAEAPPLRDWMADWVDHHAGRDFGRLRRARRIEYDVRANWKIVAENFSECYHCPPVHPILNRLTPYDLGEDFDASGPWKGGWMPFAEACETMAMDGLRHGRPALPGLTAVDERRVAYYLLWPTLILSVHPDYLLVHHSWPLAPDRTRVVCDFLVDPVAMADPGFDLENAVAFWDLTNRQDYHVVELQQRGTASRAFAHGRYSNQEASVHAFDLMVVDRYADDGVRTPRGRRTGEGRPSARRGGQPATTG